MTVFLEKAIGERSAPLLLKLVEIDAGISVVNKQNVDAFFDKMAFFIKYISLVHAIQFPSLIPSCKFIAFQKNLMLLLKMAKIL